MNKKGFAGIATFLALFVGIITAIALFQPSAANVATGTDQFSLVNRTFTAPSVGNTIDMVGQELFSTPIVTNATSGAVVPANNYTIAEGVSTVDGLKRVRYTALAGPYVSQSVNISYDYGAEGYMDDGGSRAIFDLVLVFGALAVAVIVLSRVMEDGGDIFG